MDDTSRAVTSRQTSGREAVELPARGWKGPLWKLEMDAGVAGALLLGGEALLILAAIGAGALFSSLHRGIGIGPLEVAAFVVVTVVLHELVHAAAVRAYGGRPGFGVGCRKLLPYAYVSCRGHRFTRNQFLVVALAPLVVLDLVGILLMLPSATAAFAFVVVVVNTSGAVGDLWSALVILQRPSWVHYEDSGLSFAALAPPERSREADELKPPVGLTVPLLAWVTSWFAASLVSLIVLDFTLPALILRSIGTHLWIGPVLVAYSAETSTGVEFGLNLAATLALAAASGAVVVFTIALIRAWLSRFRRSSRA